MSLSLAETIKANESTIHRRSKDVSADSTARASQSRRTVRYLDGNAVELDEKDV